MKSSSSLNKTSWRSRSVMTLMNALLLLIVMLGGTSILVSEASSLRITKEEATQQQEQDFGKRHLQSSGTVPTNQQEFIQMCTSSLLQENPNRLYRDDFSDEIFHWVESDLIAGSRAWDTSALSNLEGETTHLPNYHLLPSDVMDKFESTVCPYYLRITPRTSHVNSYKMRFCRNPNQYARTPSGIYMPVQTLRSRNSSDLIKSMTDMCNVVFEHWNTIQSECIERWQNQGLITPRNGGGGGSTTLPPTTGDEYDSIRFSKLTFKDPTYQQQYGSVLPLTSKNYPLDETTYQSIRYSTAVSPVRPDDHQVVKQRGINDYITVVMRGPPPHPSKNSDGKFWVYFRHVLDLQIHRRQYGNELVSRTFPVPQLWENFTCNDSAEAVHDEYPGLWQAELINHWLTTKSTKVDPTIIPLRANTDFVNAVISLAHLNTWSIDAIAATSFCTKWTVGRARPEEVAWKITTGELTEGVPADIRTKVLNMRLRKAEEFTAYPEGCPPHPSWPAMHSAASSLSLWLAVVCDLTPDQLYQTKLTDHAVAYSRSIAGVHYHDDNLAGLNLGQEIIAELLPDYLAQKYGSDPDVVRAKVEQYRFDWFQFDRELFQNEWPQLGATAGTIGGSVQKLSSAEQGRNRNHDTNGLFEEEYYT